MNVEVAHMLEEHGLRGVAMHYLADLRGMERRPTTIIEVQGSLRSFLRWTNERFGQKRGERINPDVLSAPLLHAWWTWMLSPGRETVAHVRRAGGYDRVCSGPLKRSSAYKHWTSVLAFWRWAAQVDEFEGAVPRFPGERLRKPYRDPQGDPSARRRYLAPSWAQAAACVAALPDWVRPLAILCYYTGLRVKQARSLTWGDVHFDDAHASACSGPVLWVGDGKTEQERDGHFIPLHPDLARWLRARRAQAPGLGDLAGDLRRTGTKAYAARERGLAEGRIAWEVGDQNVSLQLSAAWRAASVPREFWVGRTAHAFRKALRTNVVCASTETHSRVWQAAERLIGHRLPGQVDIYQDDRALMPMMRELLASVPRWEDAARMGALKLVPQDAAWDDLLAMG